MNLLESTGFVEEPVYPFDNGMVLDRTVRVPLAAFRSGAEGAATVADGLAELRALFPTLVRLSGARPPAAMSEADLLRTGTPPSGDEQIYTEFGDMLGLRRGRHLIVFRGFLHDGNSVDPELDRRLNDVDLTTAPDHYVLHDVDDDPWQARDLSREQRELFLKLRGELIDVRSAEAAVPRDALTPERLWELRMSPTQGYW